MNSILDESIQSLQLFDPTSKMELSADKLSILNLRAITESGSQAKLIEMIIKLHKNSTPLSFIAEVADLSIEEFQLIIKNHM